MRKGSLQLSINAIVILIMAIAMLGVGIFFIKTVLQGELGTISGLSADVKAQIKAQMQQTGEKLFLSGVSDGEFVVGQNEQKNIEVVVMNQEVSQAEFFVSVVEDTGDAQKAANSNPEDDFLGITSFYSEGAKLIPVNEVEPVVVTFDTGNERGRVIYTIRIEKQEVGAATKTLYAAKSFHLVVK